MENDIDKQIASARKELTGLRGQLPGPNLSNPDAWLTVDQAADLLGLSAHEAEQRLAKAGLSTDLSRRKVIAREKFDSYVINVAAGKPTDTFL